MQTTAERCCTWNHARFLDTIPARARHQAVVHAAEGGRGQASKRDGHAGAAAGTGGGGKISWEDLPAIPAGSCERNIFEEAACIRGIQYALPQVAPRTFPTVEQLEARYKKLKGARPGSRLAPEEETEESDVAKIAKLFAEFNAKLEILQRSVVCYK